MSEDERAIDEVNYHVTNAAILAARALAESENATEEGGGDATVTVDTKAIDIPLPKENRKRKASISVSYTEEDIIQAKQYRKRVFSGGPSEFILRISVMLFS